mgnify:CR=1 FL=1
MMDTAPRSWFKHSSDSLSEPDIKRVKQKFGKLQGYAMYYISVELMIKHGGHIKECDLDLFCEDYGLEANELSEFFRFCLDSGVFTLSENGYTCELADFTINKRNYIKTIASEAGKKSAEARQEDSDPEPKKPKQPSLAPEIIEHWNANAKALRCKKLTSDIEKAVAKRCKEYTIDEIKQGIENYHSVLNDPACFFSYKWNLGEFLSRANGFPVFAGDRDEIIDKYRKSVGKNANPEQPKSRKELLEAYK